MKKQTQYIKQLFALTKNNLSVAVLSYFLTIKIATYLGSYYFGVYSYIMLLGSVFGILVNFSTNSTSTVLMAKYKSKLKVFHIVFSIRLFFLAILCCCIPFLMLKGTLITIGVIIFSISILNLSYFYELNRKNISYSYIFLMERLFYLGIVAGLLFLKILTLQLILATYFFSIFISICFQYWQNKKAIRTFKFLKLKQLLEYLKGQVSLVIIEYSTFAYGGFSRLIIEGKYGMADLGVYSLGWQITMAATLFQAQVTRVWRLNITNALVNSNLIELKKLVKNYILLSTIPIVGIAGLITFLSAPFVSYLFGNEYASLTQLIPIFSVYFVVINLDTLSTLFWISIGNRLEYLLYKVGTSAIMLIMLFTLPNNAPISQLAMYVVGNHGVSVIILLIVFYFRYIKKIRKLAVV